MPKHHTVKAYMKHKATAPHILDISIRWR